VRILQTDWVNNKKINSGGKLMFNQIAIDQSLLKSLVTLGSIIEARDKYTGGHVWRVGQYARLLGNSMHLKDEALFLLELGGVIHDIGKIGTPDAILNKPDKLSDDEYDIMKKHAVLGATLVKNHPLELLVVDTVSDHHERLDGKGYPLPKSETELTLHARIMSVADAFDAMTSERPYRKGMNPDKAISILKENIGTQFDPEVVRHMGLLFEKGALSETLYHAGFGRKLLSCPACGPVIAPTSKHKDGNHINCPACGGDYIIHKHGDSFEIVFTENILNQYEPVADEDAIDYIIKVSPKKIKLPRR